MVMNDRLIVMLFLMLMLSSTCFLAISLLNSVMMTMTMLLLLLLLMMIHMDHDILSTQTLLWNTMLRAPVEFSSEALMITEGNV